MGDERVHRRILWASWVTKGYRSACYWYARPHVAKFGAIPDDARVVIDRDRASGGGSLPDPAPALAMVGKWEGLEKGKLAELLIEYRRSHPSAWRPERASPETLAVAEPILKHEMPATLVEAAARRRGFIG